jgi:UDP-N-acetylglucosamine 2-epimerase
MPTDTYIHPTANVSPKATIGAGAKIWINVQIREEASIGEGCILSKDVYIDHKVSIGRRCKIQNGVSVYNGVELGDDVFVGPNAVFTNDRIPRAFNAEWKITPTFVHGGLGRRGHQKRRALYPGHGQPRPAGGPDRSHGEPGAGQEMKTVMTVIGTRPEIIKMSPLIPLLDKAFKHLLIHSGQHYSPNMDRIFFDELRLRQPDAVLDCGGLPPAEQVACVMTRLEKLIVAHKPDAVVVHGDTNTTLAAALTGAKYKESGVKVIHVEAGCRSRNPLQTEEINRLVVDRISDLMFVSTAGDAENLAREGIDPKAYHVTGNTVVDSCARAAGLVDDKSLMARFGLAACGYCLVTMHRQETVDHPVRLSGVLSALEAIAEKVPVVLPLHPRTAKKMADFGLAFKSPGFRILDPIGYTDMIGLMKNARFCVTDSGGMQEEVTVLRVPTLVIRKETEYMHYVKAGVLRLTGTDTAAILAGAEPFLKGPEEGERVNKLRIDFPEAASAEIVRRIASFLG